MYLRTYAAEHFVDGMADDDNNEMWLIALLWVGLLKSFSLYAMNICNTWCDSSLLPCNIACVNDTPRTTWLVYSSIFKVISSTGVALWSDKERKKLVWLSFGILDCHADCLGSIRLEPKFLCFASMGTCSITDNAGVGAAAAETGTYADTAFSATQAV